MGVPGKGPSLPQCCRGPTAVGVPGKGPSLPQCCRGPLLWGFQGRDLAYHSVVGGHCCGGSREGT